MHAGMIGLLQPNIYALRVLAAIAVLCKNDQVELFVSHPGTIGTQFVEGADPFDELCRVELVVQNLC